MHFPISISIIALIGDLVNASSSYESENTIIVERTPANTPDSGDYSSSDLADLDQGLIAHASSVLSARESLVMYSLVLSDLEETVAKQFVADVAIFLNAKGDINAASLVDKYSPFELKTMLKLGRMTSFELKEAFGPLVTWDLNGAAVEHVIRQKLDKVIAHIEVSQPYVLGFTIADQSKSPMGWVRLLTSRPHYIIRTFFRLVSMDRSRFLSLFPNRADGLRSYASLQPFVKLASLHAILSQHQRGLFADRRIQQLLKPDTAENEDERQEALEAVVGALADHLGTNTLHAVFPELAGGSKNAEVNDAIIRLIRSIIVSDPLDAEVSFKY